MISSVSSSTPAVPQPRSQSVPLEAAPELDSFQAAQPHWGARGHSVVHRQAFEHLPETMPAFFRAAEERVVGLASEPDRWKIKDLHHLTASTRPDHYLAYELLDGKPLPPDRFAMAVAADKAGRTPEQAGMLPYRVAELYQNLTAEFAFWRNESAVAGPDTTAAHGFADNALYDAGLMGHYVGDASQPMHASIHRNGWDASTPNPNGYRTAPGFHREFETLLVNGSVDEQRVSDQVGPTVHLNGDPLNWGLDFVKESNGEVEHLYQLEKAGALKPDQPAPAGVQFAESRLARGAENLRNLWFSAWVDSEPLAKAIAADKPE